MFWLRGNRVYDFHGDRGTVADFEADLLTREVEDDATCRSRRQSLGQLGAVTRLVMICYETLQQTSCNMTYMTYIINIYDMIYVI